MLQTAGRVRARNEKERQSCGKLDRPAVRSSSGVWSLSSAASRSPPSSAASRSPPGGQARAGRIIARQRVAVPVDDLPVPVLAPEDRGDPEFVGSGNACRPRWWRARFPPRRQIAAGSGGESRSPRRRSSKTRGQGVEGRRRGVRADPGRHRAKRVTRSCCDQRALGVAVVQGRFGRLQSRQHDQATCCSSSTVSPPSVPESIIERPDLPGHRPAGSPRVTR